MGTGRLGIWWTWDARLTATLVLWLIYVAYLVLRNVVDDRDRMRTLSAVIAIFGYCDVPLVYMTTRLWRTQHPAPVFFGGPFAGVAPNLLPAVQWNIFAWLAWGILVVGIRYTAERRKQGADQADAAQAIAMSAELVIRRAEPSENESVHALVQAIADETFAHLFASSQVPIGEANWLSAWLGISGEEIVGVTMTRDEWISDLWVRSDRRRTGIGGKLMAHAEREIRSRGHHALRLRVVKSNSRAVEFYQHHGWSVHHEFPHEKFAHRMLEMTKSTE